MECRSAETKAPLCISKYGCKDERAGERFACVSAVSGLDVPDDGRGVSVVDWDGRRGSGFMDF